MVYALACGSYNRLLPAEPTGWRMLRAGFARAIFLAALWRAPAETSEGVAKEKSHPSWSRAWLVPSVAFVVVFAVGFVSQLRHFRGQFDNYPSRVVIVPGAATATNPVIGPDGLFFTASACVFFLPLLR